MKTEKKIVELVRMTPLGKPVKKPFQSNSGAVQRALLKSRERVIHAGGTRVGSFKD